MSALRGIRLWAVVCCLLVTSAALAASVAPDVDVPWDARYGGGGLTASEHYGVNGTVGQGVIGWTESPHYGVGAGYWYGVESGHAVYLPVVVR